MSARLRALVVDDERLARKRLRDLLARHPEIEVVGEADGLESAREAAEALRPDLLFLDVELSPGNGFDLLPLLGHRPTTIFVTAYEAFAVRAFDVTAFDYLLKPVQPERLARAVERLLAEPPAGGPAEPEAKESPATAASAAEGRIGPGESVALKDAGTVRIVEASSISAIKAEGAYSRVLLSDSTAMMVLRGISEWARLLSEAHFLRIDRSLIVRLASVRAVETVSRDEALVSFDGLPTPLAVGRAASLRLRRGLAGATGGSGLDE